MTESRIGRIRIAVAHPRLGRGGSEARALWAVEALKDLYEVSIVSGEPIDLAGLNRFYGTEVRPDEVRLRQYAIPGLMPKKLQGDALRGVFYQRFCRKVAQEFDVLISTYNLCDFGVPAIHCIADFSWDDEIRQRLHPAPAGARGLFHRKGVLRGAYLLATRCIRRPSGRDLFAGEDMILANSKWSAGIIHKKYGSQVEVLYPPVAGDWPHVPVEKKEPGFVCLGRISPEKRIERIIEILARVRALGHDVHLHVIGGLAGKYGDSIRRLGETQGGWVYLEGRKAGQEKKDLLAGHTFAIHACQGEAFGIAVAEMVKAGCIPFVPDEGGQVEIVNNPDLTYVNVEDAVNKIDVVLRDAQRQDVLRGHLRTQGELFSAERFMAGIRAAVEQFLEDKRRRCAAAGDLG